MLDQFKIIKCEPLPGYKLDLTFADGKRGIVDISHLAGKGVFALWNDYEEFRKVQIDPVTKTVCWRGELDLDPLKLRSSLQ